VDGAGWFDEALVVGAAGVMTDGCDAAGAGGVGGAGSCAGGVVWSSGTYGS